MPSIACTVDIKENNLLKIDSELLEILLKDKTTGKNIIWATDNYTKYGAAYNPDQEIKIDLITGQRGSIIRPRTKKSKAEQQQRVRQKAEVFTPSWVCNAQNNLVDDAWFGRKDVFNTEKETENGTHVWTRTEGKIVFPDWYGKRWQDYVRANRLEIPWGEAPFLTSRYDAVTGEFIEVNDRIGMLDRKLRVVGENTESRDEWIEWATVALQGIYGFDWQGDNVLIARENILFSVIEQYEAKFNEKLETQDVIGFAEIIAWNIWQMDGLRFVVPNSCCTKEAVEEDLFERKVVAKPCEGCKIGFGEKSRLKHNGIYCTIMNWQTGKSERFVDSLKGEK